MSDNKRNLETLFYEALDITSAAARQAFLDEQCGNDDQLRAKLEELLTAHSDMGGFLDETRSDAPASLIPEALGTKIGRYKLLQVIGEGGMGVVYMAQQQEPVQRRVALKIIKLGMDTKEVVARFEAERQALAMMDHPNIARALDAGATETGRPYFVMELVQGIPITEFCDRNKQTTKQRLALFIDVCHAIQSAHQKGIIHRDIKPSNVLVTLHHGEPMPKVIDFGVAKAVNQQLTEKTYFTRYATMIGTPAYMSPEQAEMSSMDVDTRTDVYSLGVLLYRLLTGSTPFPEERLRSAGYGEMQRIIVEELPERPSTRMSSASGHSQKNKSTQLLEFDASLARDLKGELDWITLKCLEKDRGRRYDTPNELAADIRRFLDEEPVLAVAPTFSYQLKKLYQRHKTVTRLIAMFLLTLVLGLVFSTWQWIEAENARDTANRKSSEATESLKIANQQKENAKKAEQEMASALYRSNIVRARFEIGNGNAAGAKTSLDTCPDELRGWEWHLLNQMTDASMLTLKGHSSWVYDVACSPDGRWIASAGGGDPLYLHNPGRTSEPGEVIIWDANSGQKKHTIRGHNHVIEGIAFSPDSKLLASASFDQTIRFWNVETGLSHNQPGNFADDAGFHCVAFSADGKFLAAGGLKGNCWLWNLENGERRKVQRHDYPVTAVKFSSDSKRLYSLSIAGATGRGLVVWNLESDEETVLDMGSLFGDSIGLSPEFNRIAVARGRHVKFWDTRTQKLERPEWTAHKGFVEEIVFNPDGLGQFATCSINSLIRVWKSSTDPRGDPDYLTLLGHEGRVLAMDYMPDGNRLVSGGSDGTVRVWDLTGNAEYCNLPLPRSITRIRALAFGPNNDELTLGRARAKLGGFTVMNVHSNTPIRAGEFEGASTLREVARKGNVSPGDTIDLDSTGKSMFGVTRTPEAKPPLTIVSRWELPSGNLQMQYIGHTVNVENVSVSANSARLATGSAVRGDAGKLGEIKVWDVATAKVVLDLKEDGLGVTRLALSPQGDLLAVACTHPPDESVGINSDRKSSIRIYDVATGHKLKSFDSIQEIWMAICFDPTGKRLAAGSQKRSVVVWDLSDDRKTVTSHGLAFAGDIAFNPDGQRLAIVSKYSTRILDADSGEELLTLLTYGQNTAGREPSHPRACWSHDGRSLAVLSGSSSIGSVSLWTIPDFTTTPITPEEQAELLNKRAVSNRVQSTHSMAYAGNAYQDNARNRLKHIVDVPLNSSVEYRMRAYAFEKLEKPEQAVADIAEAERLESLSAKE